MDGKKDVPLTPDHMAAVGQAYAVIMDAARLGNNASQHFLVAGGSEFSPNWQAGGPKIPHGVRGKMADGFTMIYFRDHATDDPTSEDIAAASGGQFDAKTIRKTPTWIASQKARGRRTDQIDDLGENDSALEELKGTKPSIKDRSTIRRR